MRKTAGVAVLVTFVASLWGSVSPAHAQANQPPSQGQAIVQTALSYAGSPYTATGTNPQTGFSDVGFVRYVFRSNGIRLHVHVSPGAYRRILADGPKVARGDLQLGDIIVFKNTTHAGLSHVGIYIGDGKFVHAEWYNVGVTVTALSNDPRDGNYWTQHYVTAIRAANTATMM